jgi:hypothetical protein|tara:strand:- start:1518 stop:1838 length:321 start_codon:yes stop_codon:yes gene_type:complete
MTKDNENIMMITLTNGMEIIFQVVEFGDEWYTIQNPVAMIQDKENDRINMSPLFTYGKRDSDIKLHSRKVDVIYSPTSGLTEEYLTVFVNPPAESVETEVEETVEA